MASLRVASARRAAASPTALSSASLAVVDAGEALQRRQCAAAVRLRACRRSSCRTATGWCGPWVRRAPLPPGAGRCRWPSWKRPVRPRITPSASSGFGQRRIRAQRLLQQRDRAVVVAPAELVDGPLVKVAGLLRARRSPVKGEGGPPRRRRPSARRQLELRPGVRCARSRKARATGACQQRGPAGRGPGADRLARAGQHRHAGRVDGRRGFRIRGREQRARARASGTEP